MKESLATYGYSVLEIMLVRMEMCSPKIDKIALANEAQLVGGLSCNQKVANSIPGQGTYEK